MASSTRSLETVLARVPLFAELSRTELAALAARAGRKCYQSDTLVFSEGSACTELLVVEEGAVRLFKTSPDGREQLIAIERRGGTLAEVPIFDGGTYSFSAVAIEPTTLVQLPAGRFREICICDPNMAAKLIKVLAHRLRHLDRLVEQLSFSTVRSRLIAHLLSTAASSSTASTNSASFDLNENNEELAARLGTVRELVSRNLGRLHNDGLIAMRRRHVTIPDLPRLKRELT